MAFTWEANQPASVRLGDGNPTGTTMTIRGIDTSTNDAQKTDKGIKALFWLSNYVDDQEMVTNTSPSLLITASAVRVINEDIEESE